MNSIIAVVSIVILVLEGVELFKTSSFNAFVIAAVAGLCYAIYNGTKHIKVDIGLDDTPDDKETDNEEDPPKQVKFSLFKPAMTYKNYAYEREKTQKMLGWNVEYRLKHNREFTFVLLASRDIDDLTKANARDTSGLRRVQRAIQKAGGYTPANAFASIHAIRENESTASLPDEYLCLFEQNSTPDVVANNLLNKINQYLGAYPSNIYHQ